MSVWSEWRRPSVYHFPGILFSSYDRGKIFSELELCQVLNQINRTAYTVFYECCWMKEDLQTYEIMRSLRNNVTLHKINCILKML